MTAYTFAERERERESDFSLFFLVSGGGRHPRFATLTANIRKRRGRKVNIKVPLYIDTHTDERLQKENMPNGDDDLYMSGLPV